MKRLLVSAVAIGVVGAGLLMVGAGLGEERVAAQDVTTDVSLLLRGTIPRVSVTVDGATTFAISPRMPWAYVLLACTGAETIDTITGGRQGTVLIVEHSDTDCTIADDDTPTAANAIDVTGVATNDVGAAAKVMLFVFTGTSWMEIGESDN